MKNLLKLVLVAIVAATTIIACDPPHAGTAPVDSLKTIAPDTTGTDTLVKPDSLKDDSVKK